MVKNVSIRYFGVDCTIPKKYLHIIGLECAHSCEKHKVYCKINCFRLL